MKATELMIGDWVYNKNCQSNMQVFPMMFSQMFRRTPNATTEDYNVFPIPITKEILEKNGFEKENRTVGNRNTYYYTADNNWWLTISGEGFFKGVINTVHQLQHALKLCGIEKEIVI